MGRVEDMTIVMPVFCPRCGVHMKDQDTDEDVTKRWLRCGLCGYCMKPDPSRYADFVEGRNKKSPPVPEYMEDSRKIKK